MKRILVTGATGFIGRHVIEYLLSAGHSLITTAIEEKDVAEIFFPLLKQTDYIPKNLNEKENDYYGFFRKPDYLIHLSWEGLPNYNELFHVERNLSANYIFIKNMVEKGLSDLSIVGTCFEYGLQNGCLKEDMQTNPVTVYGLAKDTLRKFVETLQMKYSFNMKWIRLFYPYGHGQSKKSLWSQLEEAIINKQKKFNMSSGEQLRDYLPISHVAEYISKITLQNNITGIINCCSGQPVSARSFVERFFEERKYPITLNRGCYSLPDYEPLAFWGNTSKLNKIIQSDNNSL
jgi:dTDP-6-deoxy-L-talose 4-dehydrogenase (NAD+)